MNQIDTTPESFKLIDLAIDLNKISASLAGFSPILLAIGDGGLSGKDQVGSTAYMLADMADHLNDSLSQMAENMYNMAERLPE